MKAMTKNWTRSVAGVAILAVFILGVLATARRAEARTEGRVLSEAEMAGLFGDGDGATDESVSLDYNCNSPFKDGTSDCAYCDSGVQRLVCCKLGVKTNCRYGTKSACGKVDRYVGPISGSPGTCGSCTTGNPQPMGTCKTITDAEGDNCP